MKTCKFTITEDHYRKFKARCASKGQHVVKRIEKLVRDDLEYRPLYKYSPSVKSKEKEVSVKIPDDMHKELKVKCAKHSCKIKDYISYVIYADLKCIRYDSQNRIVIEFKDDSMF